MKQDDVNICTAPNAQTQDDLDNKSYGKWESMFRLAKHMAISEWKNCVGRKTYVARNDTEECLKYCIFQQTKTGSPQKSNLSRVQKVTKQLTDYRTSMNTNWNRWQIILNVHLESQKQIGPTKYKLVSTANTI